MWAIVCLVPCSRVPRHCSECVLAPPTTTRTPSMFHLHWVLNQEPSAARPVLNRPRSWSYLVPWDAFRWVLKARQTLSPASRWLCWVISLIYALPSVSTDISENVKHFRLICFLFTSVNCRCRRFWAPSASSSFNRRNFDAAAHHAGRRRPDQRLPRLARLMMANLVLNSSSLRKIIGGRMSAADIFAESKLLKKVTNSPQQSTFTRTQ